MKKGLQILIYVLVPILCFSIGVCSILFVQNLNPSRDASSSDTSKIAVSINETESITSYTLDKVSIKKKSINDFVLENGTTTDGIEYEYKINDKSKLYTIDNGYVDSLRFKCRTTAYKGYNIELSYELGADKISILFDDYNSTEEYCECWLSVDAETYNKADRPSAIDIKWTGSLSKDKITLNWSPHSEEAKDIVNNFTPLIAQEHFEIFLTCLKEDLCPLYDWTLSDFGFKSYN